MAIKQEEELLHEEEDDQDGERAQADTVDALLNEHEEYEDDGDPFGMYEEGQDAEDIKQEDEEPGALHKLDSGLATQDSRAQAASSGSRGRPMPEAYYMDVSQMEQPDGATAASSSQQDTASIPRGHQFTGAVRGPAVDRGHHTGQQQFSAYPGHGGRHGGRHWDGGRGRGRANGGGPWFPHDGPRHPGPGGPGMMHPMPPMPLPHHHMMPSLAPHGMPLGPPPPHLPPPRPPPFPAPGPAGRAPTVPPPVPPPRPPTSGTPPLAPQPGTAPIDTNSMMGMPSILRPAPPPGAPAPTTAASTATVPIATSNQGPGVDQQQPSMPHVMGPGAVGAAGAWRPPGPAPPAEGPRQAWHAPPLIDTASTHLREASPAPEVQSGDMLSPTATEFPPEEFPWPPGPGLLPGAPGFMGPMLPGVLVSNKWVRPGATAAPGADATAAAAAKEAKDAELQSRLALIERRKREQAARRAAAAAGAATTSANGKELVSTGSGVPAPAPEGLPVVATAEPTAQVAALLQAQEEYIAKLRRAIALQEAAANKQGRKSSAGVNGSSSSGLKRAQPEQSGHGPAQAQHTEASTPVVKRARRVVKQPAVSPAPVTDDQQDTNQFCEELEADDADPGQELPGAGGNGNQEFELDFDQVLLGSGGAGEDVDEEMDLQEDQLQQAQLEQQVQVQSPSHRQQGVGKQHGSSRQEDRQRARSSERHDDIERHSDRRSHRHHHHQRRAR